MVHSAPTRTQNLRASFDKPEGIDLKAGADRSDPDFGGSTLTDVQAAGVSFTPGKTSNVRAVEHFLMPGVTVKIGDIVEQVPESDARFLISSGKAVAATDEEVAAAQKKGSK